MSLHLAHNFLSEDDAEHLLEEVLHMPEDWWFTAYKANDTRIIGNKGVDTKQLYELDNTLTSLMRENKFVYRFRRTTDHMEGCTCFLCKIRDRALKTFLKGFIEEQLNLKNLELGEYFLSSYRQGDFLATHTDQGNGVVAFVLNLTKDWRPEYGGMLHVETSPNCYSAVNPEFNSLVIMEIKEGEDLNHFVSEVTKSAPDNRIAISGWFTQGN
jgi:Rps23 Pro-64 3,4-dihydroxylase Tpa1-like proline 4-hydroxylase